MISFTNPSRPELWQRLVDQQIASGPLPALDASTPWYVRTILCFAGWLAALFVLGVLGMSFAAFFDRPVGCLLVGLALIGCATASFRVGRRNELMAQFGLALSLAGQALVVYGFTHMSSGNVRVIAMLVAALELGLFFIIPNFLHRVLSSIVAALAVTFLLSEWWLVCTIRSLITLGFVAVWLHGHDRLAESGWRAAGYGLALALVGIAFSNFHLWLWYSHTAHVARWMFTLSTIDRMSAVATLPLAVYLIRRWQQALRPGDNHTVLFAWLAVVPVAAASWLAPMLGALLAVLITAFATGSRVLLGLASAALLAYLSQYYYSLHLTLLNKSMLLIATGTTLLAMRFVLQKLTLPGISPPATATPVGAKESSSGALSTERWRAVAAMLAGLLVLALANFNIIEREALLRDGRIARLELAPVDPRSLMQGDYMALRFAVANEAFPFSERSRNRQLGDKGFLILKNDATGVSRFVRLDDGTPLAIDEFRLRYRLRNGQPLIVTNAYFFEEGTAERFAQGRLGELRVGADGEALLTGLLDKDGKELR